MANTFGKTSPQHDSATTILHRRDSARFPPDVTLGIQAKEFNLGFIRPAFQSLLFSVDVETGVLGVLFNESAS